MFIPGPAAVLSQPVQRLPVSFFISDDLKKELQRRSELMLKGSSHDGSYTAPNKSEIILTNDRV
jgi:hypothetical protein